MPPSLEAIASPIQSAKRKEFNISLKSENEGMKLLAN
jgi:hypothetical protein